MEAQVYSVEECAQILHIGRQLAYELIRQNKLPAIRLGAKRLVVPRVALERYLAEVGKNKAETPV